MSCTKTALAGSISALLLIAGCTSGRFSSPYQTYQSQPTIRTAPVGEISQSQLPPPDGMNGYPQDNEQIAALETPNNALELSPDSIAGVWKASLDGMPCQIATPMTKFAQGYRAGVMRCPVALSSINVWNVQGRELVFYNRGGEVQATLYSTSGTSFIGRTREGIPLSLTR